MDFSKLAAVLEHVGKVGYTSIVNAIPKKLDDLQPLAPLANVGDSSHSFRSQFVIGEINFVVWQHVLQARRDLEYVLVLKFLAAVYQLSRVRLQHALLRWRFLQNQRVLLAGVSGSDISLFTMGCGQQ